MSIMGTEDYLRSIERYDGLLPFTREVLEQAETEGDPPVPVIVPLPFDASHPPEELADVPEGGFEPFHLPFDPSVPGARDKVRAIGWRLTAIGRAYAAGVRGEE